MQCRPTYTHRKPSGSRHSLTPPIRTAFCRRGQTRRTLLDFDTSIPFGRSRGLPQFCIIFYNNITAAKLLRRRKTRLCVRTTKRFRIDRILCDPRDLHNICRLSFPLGKTVTDRNRNVRYFPKTRVVPNKHSVTAHGFFSAPAGGPSGSFAPNAQQVSGGTQSGPEGFFFLGGRGSISNQIFFKR